MKDISLGRIESVHLRDIWTSEDRHFTPWLAQAENLELISEILGIDLELEAVEKDIGPFRADILCKNAFDESWVLIENQLEKTDHKHLGQLLTYAAGLKTVTIVWISSRFCDEHKNALDWLNEFTHESIRFFGLEIELCKIGNSIPAPRFKVICQPNNWTKAVGQIRQNALIKRPSHILRMKYWTAFNDYLESQNNAFSKPSPQTKFWHMFSIGTSKAYFAALLINRDKKIGFELCVKNAKAKQIYLELYEQREHIDNLIGEKLEWIKQDDKKLSKIVTYYLCSPEDENDWENQFKWLYKNLTTFSSVFRPYFK
jgi:hypothetical protein